MSEPRFPLQPNLAVRLACWFFIYLAAAALDAWGTAVMPRWNYTPNWFFWNCALHVPDDLQLLISGLLGLDDGGFGSKVARAAAYGCYFLNFIFSLTLPGKRAFWMMIALLAVLLFLGILGTCLYVRVVFKTT